MEMTSSVSENTNKLKTSKELLSVKGNGSQKCIVKSLMRKDNCAKNRNSFQTFKMNRSPLFDQLQEFLPKFEKSTAEILEKPECERQELDVENVEGCDTVVEMNILLGEMNSDSSDSDSSSDEEETTPTICPDTFKLNYSNKNCSNNNDKKKNLISEIKDSNVKLKVGEGSGE